MKKKEFYPNTFRTPNTLVDQHLRRYSGAEAQVMLVIVRKTYGWMKTEDEISTSQIQELTGIECQKTIRKAIKNLIEMGHIELTKDHTSRRAKRYRCLLNEIPSTDENSSGGNYTPPEGEADPPREGIKPSPEGELNPPQNLIKPTNKPTEQNITNAVKTAFDIRYEKLYGEKFVWNSPGRIGKDIKIIISNGNSDINAISKKMDALVEMCEDQKGDFWKFNYTTIANRWNEIVLPGATAEKKEWHLSIIALWNKLTGANLETTDSIIFALEKSDKQAGLDGTKKSILAYAVSEWHTERRDWNLLKMLSNPESITKYWSDYDAKGLGPVIKKRLSSQENTLFPQITHQSDRTELMKYDWMQHGLDNLVRHVIGPAAGNRIVSGESSVQKEIERRLDQEIINYANGENNGTNHIESKSLLRD